VVTIPLRWTSDDEAVDIIAIQGDGKIIVGGNSARPNGNDDFVMVRYDNAGMLDPSFGVDGRVVTDFTFDHEQPCDRTYFSDDTLTAIAVQADGKILAAGHSYIGSDYSWCTTGRIGIAMARFNPDGTLDETFGEAGKSLILDEAGTAIYANDIALQPDGKIVMAGGGRGYTIARLTANGILDATFATDGFWSLQPFNVPGFQTATYLNAVELQPDGKIVALGAFYITWPPGDYFHLNRWNVMRLDPNGALDTSFNPDGGGILNIFLWGARNDLAIQPDGKIVIAGGAVTREPDRTALANFTLTRVLADGSPDYAFGTEGLVRTEFGLSVRSALGNEEGRSIKVQEDGRILVAGYVTSWHETDHEYPVANRDFALVRYNNDGSHDYSFGNAGKVITEFGSTYDIGESVAIQADGRILVAGWSSQNHLGQGKEIAIARYEGVSTKLDELEGLVLRVQELRSAEILNDGQAKSLHAKLRAAIQQVDRQNFNTAGNQLGAFVNHVEAFVAGSVLSTAEGQTLIDEAQDIASRLPE
jgi:uncharacterized delta-60 repeat protein